MKKAFTLIELMVVIAIIGILTAIALPRFADITDSARVAQVQGNLANLRTTIGMFYAKTDSYPTYEEAATLSKTNSISDISSEGDLSEKFAEFYSRSTMPTTPAGTIKIGGEKGNTLTESNRVVAERNNKGGWLYIGERGEIYANLIDGNYSGNPETEVWKEESIDDGEGVNPDSPNVPTGPGDWGDFIDQDNTSLEDPQKIGFDTKWVESGKSMITPNDRDDREWDKFYVYDENGNMVPNPESEDGSYNYGEGAVVASDDRYIVVLKNSETDEYLYSYIRNVNSWENMVDPGDVFN